MVVKNNGKRFVFILLVVTLIALMMQKMLMVQMLIQ